MSRLSFLLAMTPLLLILAAPTNREIMKKLNGGPTSLTPTLAQDLRDDDPDWEAIQESTALYLKLAEGLTKNKKPEKGEAASWTKLTKNHHDEARALDAAARRKDKRTAAASLNRLKNACTTCHKAHRAD